MGLLPPPTWMTQGLRIIVLAGKLSIQHLHGHALRKRAQQCVGWPSNMRSDSSTSALATAKYCFQVLLMPPRHLRGNGGNSGDPGIQLVGPGERAGVFSQLDWL